MPTRDLASRIRRMRAGHRGHCSPRTGGASRAQFSAVGPGDITVTRHPVTCATIMLIAIASNHDMHHPRSRVFSTVVTHPCACVTSFSHVFNEFLQYADASCLRIICACSHAPVLFISFRTAILSPRRSRGEGEGPGRRWRCGDRTPPADCAPVRLRRRAETPPHLRVPDVLFNVCTLTFYSYSKSVCACGSARMSFFSGDGIRVTVCVCTVH